MTMPHLTRAWASLLALSLLSTLIAVAVSGALMNGGAMTMGGALILALAWAKARVILNAYLGLATAPVWRRGFGVALALYALLLLGLYLAG